MILLRLVRVLLALALAAVVASYAMVFAVPEGFAGIVLRFGRPVAELSRAGPGWKAPWPVDELVLVDCRARLTEPPYTATFTRDKKSVVLQTYAVWRVERPLLFVQAAGSIEVAERKLAGMLAAAKNVQMGRYDLSALLSTTPGTLQMERIEEEIAGEVRQAALEKLGVKLMQVHFRRIAFPEENVPAVLAHMRAERQAEADRLRAEGERDAAAIRNQALVRAEEILREGRENAGTIRGRADRRVAELHADANQLDPELYRLWRSLEAARAALANKATVVLRSDQAFFGVLDRAPPAEAK